VISRARRVACLTAAALAASQLGAASARALRLPDEQPFPSRAAQRAEVRTLIADGRAIGCGGGNVAAIALTFDDGPGIYTRRIIRVLRRYHAHATFFVVGNRLEYWPSLPAEERRVGTVGNHTWTHPWLTALPPWLQRFELALTQAVLGRMLGEPPQLFRPPYEAHTPTTDRIARSLGLLDVLWTVDAGDAVRGATVRSVSRTVIAGLRPGAIVLMHDIQPVALPALPLILQAARRLGLAVLSVPELLALDPPAPTHHCPIGPARA